jgi:hypothetical protein
VGVLPLFLRPEHLPDVDPDAVPIDVDQQHLRDLFRERDLRGGHCPRRQEEQFCVARILVARMLRQCWEACAAAVGEAEPVV